MNYAVILAGGSGKRFWPLSRQSKPKQFLSIISSKTMIEETVDRVKGLIDKENIIILASEGQRSNFTDVDLGIPDKNILYEPEGRNTAMAIAYAAAHIKSKDPDGTMIVLPSDHYIKETDLFHQSLKDAIIGAKKGYLVTFGITPSRPDTGYGYINIDKEIDNEIGLYEVKAFTEKPNQKDAIEYMKRGNYLWNSGMFVWDVKTIVDEFKKYLPEHFNSLTSISNNPIDSGSVKKAYKNIDNISIDYGILERSSKIACIKCSFTWDDVGSWIAIERHNKHDINGNTVIGNADLKDVQNSIVVSNGGLTVMIGVNDLIVVHTSDATLVCDKSRNNEIKDIVDKNISHPNNKKYL